MGLLSFFKSRESRAVIQSPPVLPPEDFLLFNYQFNKKVSDEATLAIPTAWACVRINSESVSSLPMKTFNEFSGQLQAADQPEWLYSPWSNLSESEMLSQIMISLMLDGNAFAFVPRGKKGEPLGILPLDPSRCALFRSNKGNVYLKVQGSKEVILAPEEFMHISWLTLPGRLRGYAPLQAAAGSIQLAEEAQNLASSWLRNGAMPSAAVTFEDGISEESIQSWRNMWTQMHGGSGNAGKIVALVGTTDIKPLSFSAKESQFLESRQFSIGELCRIWGVPPHAVADSSGSTSWGSGLSQQTAGYVNFTIKPLARKIERALTDVWRYSNPTGVVQLDYNSLLLGDPDTKSKYVTSLVSGGILTPNEARVSLGYAPIEGGEELASPIALPPAEEPQPEPENVKPSEENEDEEL